MKALGALTYTRSIHKRAIVDPKKSEQKPSKKPQRQNLETEITPKRQPIKEPKQCTQKNQEKPKNTTYKKPQGIQPYNLLALSFLHFEEG
jgi:hypothetical protein